MGCLGMLNTRAPSDIVCFLSSAPYNWLWTGRPFLCKDGLSTRLFPTAGWHRSWEVNFCLPRPQACLWWDMAWKPGVLTAPDRVACCKSLISSGLLTPSEKDLHRLSAKGIYTHEDARFVQGLSERPSHILGERFQGKGSFWQMRFCRHWWSNLSLGF